MNLIKRLKPSHGILLAICCLAGQISAAPQAYPRLEMQNIHGLIAKQFPPDGSNVNCHASSMVAAGVLSVLVPLPNDEVYFKSGCFQEVANPAPGTVGFFVDEGPDMSFALHSITFVSPTQIFQKANPGSQHNPWELIAVQSPNDVRAHFPEYQDKKLKWGTYTPAPTCFLTQFQNWIDQNRKSGIYAPMIQVMEQEASGKKTVTVDHQSFTTMLTETERLLANTPGDEQQGTFQGNLLHLLHEYLILPEFAADRAKIEAERSPTGTKLAEALKKSVADSLSVSGAFKKLFAAGAITYMWRNIGVFDSSYTIYLHLPEGADADMYLLQAQDIESLNAEQNRFHLTFENTGFIQLAVTAPELDHPWTIVLGPDWLFHDN